VIHATMSTTANPGSSTSEGVISPMPHETAIAELRLLHSGKVHSLGCRGRCPSL
jgi:hypothetical protein